MWYKLTSRTLPPISLDEAKEHLRVTHDIEDDLIQALVNSVVEWAEEYTGRAFSTVQMEAITEVQSDVYYIERFTPVASIVSVVDAGTNAVAHTIKYPNEITITDELTDEQYPLTISYTSESDTNSSVPITAMKLKLSDFYDYRADRAVPLSQQGQFRSVAELLLQPYKTIEFSP